MAYSVSSTVLVAAATYNLTNLNTARDELSIAANNTSKDSWILRALAGVSGMVTTYLRRVLVPEIVQDAFDIQQDPYPYQTPGGFAELVLTRWPVLGVISVIQTTAAGSSPSTKVMVQGKDYTLDPETGRLLRLNPFTGVVTTWEALPVVVQYAAGFGSIVSESGQVPSTAPYQVTVSQAATFSCDWNVASSSGTPFTRVSGIPAPGQYAVSAGIYTFNATDAGTGLAVQYAVAKVPDDIVDVVLQMLTGRYMSKGRDPSLIQRETPGVGVERFWIGTTPGQNSPFPPDVEGVLRPYKTPMVV
ncbi:MAG: hypothetical protein KGJ57_17435 [Sphingomonadales bacterium]|nr:hypothetical protein [Sphingomonadales bacterium]MDE2171181.1 hypothetical protein [Sphingomonadales bacterium]